MERPHIVTLEERIGKAKSSMSLWACLKGMIASFSLDLFVSEGDDGIELGGLLGREDPEKDADGHGHNKTQND